MDILFADVFTSSNPENLLFLHYHRYGLSKNGIQRPTINGNQALTAFCPLSYDGVTFSIDVARTFKGVLSFAGWNKGNNIKIRKKKSTNREGMHNFT